MKKEIVINSLKGEQLKDGMKVFLISNPMSRSTLFEGKITKSDHSLMFKAESKGHFFWIDTNDLIFPDKITACEELSKIYLGLTFKYSTMAEDLKTKNAKIKNNKEIK